MREEGGGMNWRGSTRLATYTHCNEGGGTIFLARLREGKGEGGGEFYFIFTCLL